MELSKENFEKLYYIFDKIVFESSGVKFKTFLKSDYIDFHENYKYEIYEEANKKLQHFLWRLNEVGQGKIYDKVSSALITDVQYNNRSFSNNLINWRKKEFFTNTKASKKLEQSLYNLFATNTDHPIVFDQLAESNLPYQLIAYLFFLKDRNRFLPISQQRFDKIFQFLNIKFKTSRNLSWENYRAFCEFIEQTQLYLIEKDKNTTLLDAHSFLWTVTKGLYTDLAPIESSGRIFTIDDWEEILLDSSLTKDIDIKIFSSFYTFDNYRATTKQVASLIDSESSSLHLRIGEYAKRIAKKRTINFTIRKNGKNKFWDIFFDGFYEGKSFIWQLKPNLVRALENRNLVKKIVYPEELVKTNEPLFEGVKKTIIVNSYERNSKAREQCLEYWGVNCKVCNLNFENTYGDIGKDFIHVHHIKPLSQIDKKYEVNPKKDLIPVCPNCHSMLHKKNPPFTVSELKKFLN